MQCSLTLKKLPFNFAEQKANTNNEQLLLTGLICVPEPHDLSKNKFQLRSLPVILNP